MKVEVQEPKLAMALSGPRSVLFGKAETFKLEVSNTGNGDAENVVLSLATDGKHSSASHTLGSVAAGQKKNIKGELIGRQPGKLTIRGEAHDSGGRHAELTEEIVVHKATLKAEVEVPKTQYVGAETTCHIRVSNPGNAPVLHPVVTATLPAGGKYVSGTPSGQSSTDGSKMTWTLANLSPGAREQLVAGLDRQYGGHGPGGGPLRCRRRCVGYGRGGCSVRSRRESRAERGGPRAPISISGIATYQVRLQNRGLAPTEGLEVVVYFDENFEPLAATGAQTPARPGAGCLRCHPQPAARPEHDIGSAHKAAVAGNHLFRVKAHAKPDGTRVVREGTTRFYGVESHLPVIARPTEPEPTRTAERNR